MLSRVVAPSHRVADHESAEHSHRITPASATSTERRVGAADHPAPCTASQRHHLAAFCLPRRTPGEDLREPLRVRCRKDGLRRTMTILGERKQLRIRDQFSDLAGAPTDLLNHSTIMSRSESRASTFAAAADTSTFAHRPTVPQMSIVSERTERAAQNHARPNVDKRARSPRIRAAKYRRLRATQ